MTPLITHPTTLDPLAGRRLLIVGLARQGLAMARFAAGVGAKITVTDLRPAADLREELQQLAAISPEIDVVVGEHPLDLLEQCELISVSGSVPLDSPFVTEAAARGLPLTNDSLEFFRRCSAKTIIGITGSAGKTTVTSLLGEMGRQSGRTTWVGGNIGRPLLPEVDQIGVDDVVIQELSSFQLDLWPVSPPVAGVLNITPNHLDRHKTMAAYTAAKANVVRFQNASDVAVLAADDPGSVALATAAGGQVIWFGLDQPINSGLTVVDDYIVRRAPTGGQVIAPVSSIRLRGRHNLLNVLAACALASAAGLSLEAQAAGIANFTGVSHRLETVRERDEVLYVNDSIATAPERALAAIAAYEEPLVLLAGGRDKNMVWEPWAATVAERVDHVILFGALTELLQAKLAAAGRTEQVTVAPDLPAAVEQAAAVASPGSIVLLSPGGTSYDSYKDFAERGHHFRDLVHDL